MKQLWKGISWSEGMRIGWLLMWRGALGGGVIGFIVGFIGGFVGLPRYFYTTVAWGTSVCVMWPIVISQMLRHDFRGFRVAILHDNPTETHRQEIIIRGAKKGATIKLESLRNRMDRIKQGYAGPDKDTYEREIEVMLQTLEQQYGSEIPLDEAYGIMKRLDSGVGLNAPTTE